MAGSLFFSGEHKQIVPLSQVYEKTGRKETLPANRSSQKRDFSFCFIPKGAIAQQVIPICQHHCRDV